MSHRPAAALMLAALVGALAAAACADARAASTFEVIPRMEAPRRPHRAAYGCALVGVGLIAASFPLADAADRRYGEYLRENDPDAIASRWDRTVWADRTAGAALLAGEALVAAAVYLRFVHRVHASRVSVAVAPGRCAIACSF